MQPIKVPDAIPSAGRVGVTNRKPGRKEERQMVVNPSAVGTEGEPLAVLDDGARTRDGDEEATIGAVEDPQLVSACKQEGGGAPLHVD